MDELKPGLTGRAEMMVGTRDTAHRVGSGRVAVLATPVMIALIEEAALDAVEHLLPAGRQSLGTRLDVSHIAATPVGMKAYAEARLVEVDGRNLVFEIEARDEVDVISQGRHERVLVGVEKFEARVAGKVATA